MDIQAVIDFVIAQKLPIGGVLIALVLGWSKIKSLFGSIKLPKMFGKSATPVVADPSVAEDEDQAALRHLRNRAAKIKDRDLIKLIKDIDSKFYDIHTVI